jgi:hypothetical protein
MVAKAKQAEKIPECNPNPLQEYSLNFKILVLLLQGFYYYVLILTKKDAHTGTRNGTSDC